MDLRGDTWGGDSGAESAFRVPRRTYYLLGEAEELAEKISACIEALDGGVDTIVLNPLEWGLGQLERLAGEVLPRVKTVR